MNFQGIKWKKIGKVKDAHGLKGDFHMAIFSGDTSWMPQLKEILLSRHDSIEDAQVVKVQRVRPFKEGLILKVEEVENRTQAEPYKGISFYIPEDLLVSKPGETIYLSEILNFTVKDADAKPIGTIQSFSSNGAQDLLCVKLENSSKIIDIPFVKEFIRKIDFKGTTILMELPEGLLDLEKL